MATQPSMPGTAARQPGSGEVVFALERFTAGYGDVPAVRDVSIEVRAGEIAALFGPNGAGKTTTLLAAAGVQPRMSGLVRWRGAVVASPLHRMARSGLAFVPEERSVIFTLSVRDNLRLGRGGVRAALQAFPELEPHLDRRASLLSGGQQQMIALARALAAEPSALLVDELSLGLAPLIVDRLLTAIRSACDRSGLAALLVEQQARRVLAVADRWYLLNHGSLVAAGDAANASEVENIYVAMLGGGRNGGQKSSITRDGATM
jgi:ABC-type branched-subunit amino acid transport system ATPase component